MDNVRIINFSPSIYDLDNIKNLYTSIATPSEFNSNSMAMAYMKEWFLKKMNSYIKFNGIYIEGKNIMRDIDNNTINENIKIEKPTVSINQQIHFDYNRDNLDLYQFGLNTYVRRSTFERSFFKDFDNNLFIAMNMRQLQYTFNFKIKVSSRAQQVDLFNYMNIAFRVGSTESDLIDMDCNIPYNLMLQVAKDAGFEVENDCVKNPIGFIKYMNEHSPQIPVIYKYRTVNGKDEFFLRLTDMYVNINNTDQLSADDGERLDMVNDNFIIEMNTILKIPAPQMFVYYSTKSQTIFDEVKSNIGLYSINVPDFPNVNEKGWNMYLTTDLYEDNPTKPVEVDFKELFKNSEIEQVINNCKLMYISPSIFIDFKMMSDSRKVNYKMDWDNMIAYTDTILKYKSLNIAVYIDGKYFQNELRNIKLMNKKFVSKGYREKKEE